MSTHAVAETTPAATDAQVIAEMAAAVLASVARIHADGVAAVTALAEAPRPVRVVLPPAAPPATEVVAEDVAEDVAEVQPVADVELAEVVEGVEDEPVVRIAQPLVVVPQLRGRHLAEAVTDQIAVQTAA